jgi:cysteine sulfinate desulfinase/cysteine desulfurase-like protein
MFSSISRAANSSATHSDGAQSLGSVAFTVNHLGVDLASFSGHKIYGLKGIGALYIRRGTIRPIPQITGGGQEYGLRPGTLNVAGIAGLGKAAAILAEQRHTDARRIAGLRDQLLAMLRTAIGLDRPEARASIRIGLGRSTTLQDITTAAQLISRAALPSTESMGQLRRIGAGHIRLRPVNRLRGHVTGAPAWARGRSLSGSSL